MTSMGSRPILRRAGAVAVGIVMTGALLSVPSAAAAEPAGCSHDIAFWLTASGQTGRYIMHADSLGSCNTSANRTLRVEIKRNVTALPDPVAHSDEDNRTSTSYYAYARGCDGGRNANYYGRGFFTQSPTYRDSSNRSVNTCR